MAGAGESRPEQRLFARLPGAWTLDRRLPGVGRMTGQARFHQVDPTLLHYWEGGRLTFDNGQTHEVSKRYHYRLENEQIWVCFAEDGPPRVMHVLRFADATTASDVHLCGQDTYTGHYEFAGADRFTVRMRVIGPRKDYSIHSEYRRAR
ncbi:hypothetical protein GCM10010174_34170 [Kutzneria viridogrisea]|uniref:DUF6314 domain-containing protein n=1 Tax=Kutzneria viridogrisea TaxID=47990 RepID=A0ABR6BMJ0_9PSEU|nr:hypothetical protein [Kutzneria viridogrisea]